MLESKFKTKLIKDIKKIIPDPIIIHGDPNEHQGITDLIILADDWWGSLEGKKGPKSKAQPNQPYYVEKMDKMSFSRFINPENKEEVLRDLQQSYESRRSTRVPRSE